MVRWECQHLADPRQGSEKGTALTTLVNKYHARDALITESIYLLQHVSNPEWVTEVAGDECVVGVFAFSHYPNLSLLDTVM